MKLQEPERRKEHGPVVLLELCWKMRLFVHYILAATHVSAYDYHGIYASSSIEYIPGHHAFRSRLHMP